MIAAVPKHGVRGERNEEGLSDRDVTAAAPANMDGVDRRKQRSGGEGENRAG
ncbi:hypothetical protein D3C87_1739520 [compost metagenome]